VKAGRNALRDNGPHSLEREALQDLHFGQEDVARGDTGLLILIVDTDNPGG
jgi:hypothetical protein